jgi:hypothetical protein
MTIVMQVKPMMMMKTALTKRVSFWNKRIMKWVTAFSAVSRGRPSRAAAQGDDDFLWAGACISIKPSEAERRRLTIG